MSWGKWLAELIPYHHRQVKAMTRDIENQCNEVLNFHNRVQHLEAELKSAAEARVRAEDNARFLQARLTDAETRCTQALDRLFLTHEKTSDFLALAVSGGRRAMFAEAPAPDPASDSAPLHQPITTGKMRAADLRSVATRMAEAQDRAKAEEARRIAQQLRQQAASERDSGLSGPGDEFGDNPRPDLRSPEHQKAAQDIAEAVEREILNAS